MSGLATCGLYGKIYISKRSGEWLLEVVGCCWMKLVARLPVVCMEVTYLFSNTCNLLSERHLNYENCDIHLIQGMFAFNVKTVPYCYNQHASKGTSFTLKAKILLFLVCVALFIGSL